MAWPHTGPAGAALKALYVHQSPKEQATRAATQRGVRLFQQPYPWDQQWKRTADYAMDSVPLWWGHLHRKSSAREITLGERCALRGIAIQSSGSDRL